MKIYFSGTAGYQHLTRLVEHPACPRVDEEVQFRPDGGDIDGGDDEIVSVRSVTHNLTNDEYDVYVVIGPPIRHW